jgi:lipoprotein-anchoring transpeptidase ErfK/SrfK
LNDPFLLLLTIVDRLRCTVRVIAEIGVEPVFPTFIVAYRRPLSMTRSLLLAGGAALALMFPAAVRIQPAHAQPIPRYGDITHSTQQPNLGGGFIELLMTGRNPGPPRHAAPVAPAPVYGNSIPVQMMHAVRSGGGQTLPVEPAPQRGSQYGGLPQHAALSPDYRQVERAIDPMYLPQVVSYGGNHRPGTIVIDTPNKFLYLVEEGGKARRYGIGVGRPGFEWAGVKSITRKAEWPDWRPPAQMLLRRPDLPRYMAGGPDNPMGARGLYLGSSLYRIHGTNEPHTIGQAVSSGCIRMRNEDVTDLYDRVRVGTRVIVM